MSCMLDVLMVGATYVRTLIHLRHWDRHHIRSVCFTSAWSRWKHTVAAAKRSPQVVCYVKAGHDWTEDASQVSQVVCFCFSYTSWKLNGPN